MKNFSKIIIIVTLIFFGQVVSAQILSALYGIKKIEKVDSVTVMKYAKKYGIPLSESFELDTTYAKFLSSFDTSVFKNQIKNHYQPLQALYYDSKGELKSFQVNCYAGGFPNLNWYRNKIMTTFPPKRQAPVDTIVPLGTLLNYLKPVGNDVPKMINKKYDYTVVVFWSVFTGRQSKRLIKTVQNNVRQGKSENIKILYVNTDNFFFCLEKDN